MQNTKFFIASSMKDMSPLLVGLFLPGPEVDTMMKFFAEQNKTEGGGQSGYAKKTTDRREVGKDPKTGNTVYVLTAKFGPVVQIGTKNAKFAPIRDLADPLSPRQKKDCCLTASSNPPFSSSRLRLEKEVSSTRLAIDKLVFIPRKANSLGI